MKVAFLWRWIGVFIMFGLLWGCGVNTAYVPLTMQAPYFPEIQTRNRPFYHQQRAPEKRVASETGWTYRVITEQELERISARDPDLSPSVIRGILARLNVKSRYYIEDDIRDRRKLKVPKNFSTFKTWTPLPRYVPELTSVPKSILVVKDIPFLGWYERGRLKDDTQICIGKEGKETRAGVYKVENKDIDHISRSYNNSLGQPAPMPWAMRIYGHVWIHAGDILGGYCSKGCINLPVPTAAGLFSWTPPGTPVLVVESLRELKTVLQENRSNCVLFASECARRKTAMNQHNF